MDDRFFHAIIGASDRVCGYDITALPPWHSVILSAINSPVLNPDKDTSAGDLLLFLKVVSCEWPNMPNLKARWRDIIWHRKLKKSRTLLKELAKLKVWLSCQLSAPELWANESEDNNTGRSLSTPSMFALVVSMVSKGNIDLSAAWNMRIAEARWYDVALAEINGADLRVAYEGEEDQLREQIQEISEDKAVEIAQRNLSPQDFEKWHEAFKNNQQCL